MPIKWLVKPNHGNLSVLSVLVGAKREFLRVTLARVREGKEKMFKSHKWMSVLFYPCKGIERNNLIRTNVLNYYYLLSLKDTLLTPLQGKFSIYHRQPPTTPTEYHAMALQAVGSLFSHHRQCRCLSVINFKTIPAPLQGRRSEESTMDTDRLEQMSDELLEQLALTISVTDARWREVWQAYEARGTGRIAQVLKKESEKSVCQS